MTVNSPIVNPYTKPRPLGGGSGHNSKIMGRQSQQRISNTKRAYSLAATNSYNGERVFSKYMAVLANNTSNATRYSDTGICLCAICTSLDPNKSLAEPVVLPSIAKPVPVVPATVSESLKKGPRQQASQDNATSSMAWIPRAPAVLNQPMVVVTPVQPYLYPTTAHYYYYTHSPAPYYCCEAYRLWRCCAKVGRPPHEHHCKLRQQQQLKA